MSKKFKTRYSLLLITVLFINILFSNTVLALEDKKYIEGTSIGGIISSDTILGIDKSPYILTEDLQVEYGATLTIEPGVIIEGDNKSIKIWGILNANGTKKDKITFNNLNIELNGTWEKNSFIDISFAEINGGSIVRPTGNGVYGNFNLRDSHIKNTKNEIHIWYPTADVNIERNIFENSGGISVGTRGNIKVYIRNNTFYNQTRGFAVENWASYDSSETIVEYNSFMSTDKIALKLPSGYNNANMTAINNYWNTNDIAVIDNMIFDKKDDLSSASIIEILPILKEPHENTPKIDYSELVVEVSSPYNGENNVNINRNIEIKFNKNVVRGDNFEQIELKDELGNNIEISKKLEGNILSIEAKSVFKLGTSYQLTIPMESITDIYGRNLNKDYNMTFTTKDELFTTNIGGVISKDTVLTVENSPYKLTEDLQVAYGATLTIEPGVIIDGDNNHIKISGVLNANGTKNDKITFNNVNIKLNGTSKENSFMDISFAEINGGSIVSPGGGSGYGSFNLRDSHIKNTEDYMYVWYPKADVNIERNIFENSGGISVGTRGSTKVYIRNNVFYKQTRGFAVENWASYNSSETIVEYNSFMSTDKIALRLPSGYNNANMTAINNYWNTNDTEVIDNMIFDKKDNLGSARIIEILPILEEPHENTPIFEYENPILSYFDLYYFKGKVLVDKPISIKFNKDIFKGSGFEKIVLKDKEGDIVQVSLSINKNELCILPNDYMLYDEGYKIEISKDSIVDINGNCIESDYTYEFKTESPRIDIDGNSKIDIMDLALLASKYNMTPKDESWNSLYDFNGDKVIDIFDLVMLAREIE